MPTPETVPEPEDNADHPEKLAEQLPSALRQSLEDNFRVRYVNVTRRPSDPKPVQED